MNYFLTLISIFFFTFLTAQPVQREHTEVELISEVESIKPGGKLWVALRMKMEDHWHVYWRNPGDSGLPTKIKWTLPEGFSAGDIQWPYPQRIDLPPLTSFGYEGEVFLLTEISVPADFKSSTPVEISGKATWLVCKEICLPVEAVLSLKLPVKNEIAKSNPKWTQTFTDAKSKLPVTLSDWKISASKETGKFVITAQQPDWFSDELSSVTFYPFEQQLIDNAAHQIFTKTKNGFTLQIQRASTSLADPKKLEGILVSNEGWRGMNSEKALNVSSEFGATETAASADAESGGLLLSLLFAFLGGIILNLMPCVLPVLSLKIMGFVQQANDQKSSVFKHGLVFTLGVLISFWILAGVLIALRTSGEQLGWGFQLQSPTFIIILSAFLFLFALSLFGVFEIGTSLTAVGNHTNQSGWLGSFMNGVTATVVATPCTAPFMGSALGYAFTQPPFVSILIFTFVGLGMAFPYLLLSSSPSLLKFVPRPGAWMETFKQFMGFLLAGTVIWLIWVLGIQAGNNAVVGLLGALLLISISAWILGKWATFVQTQTKRIIAYFISAILTATGIFIAISSLDFSVTSSSSAGISNSENGIQWENYSEARVEELKKSGTPFFLDFTAAWCLSCQVNDKVVFGSADVISAFKDKKIIAVKADWTSRDENITKALAAFGRNSVPLYVLHGKDGMPQLLPELITPGIVLDKISSTQF